MADVDVLVVGAGPVGLTLATALRRWSLEVRIVDKASGTNREPRADVIFPRAGEALGALGVGETIRDHSYQMRGARFYGSGRLLGSFEVGKFSSEFPVAMTIEQDQIERLLTEELVDLGVEVEWRTKATEMHDHGDRVDVTLRLPSGETEVVSAAWLVGCDGPGSSVRDWLGIPFEGRRRKNMQVVQGNVVPSWPLSDRPGHGYFFLAPYRSVIAFPTPAGGYRIFCVRDDPDPENNEKPTLDELRDLVADAAGIPDLKLALTDPVWLSRARFSDRVAAELRRGRVLLAGDAAHAWAPLGGHGMNVGMLGAHNLGWKLASVHTGRASEAMLDSYDREQRAIARGVIRDMRMNIMELLLPWPLHKARSAFLRAGMRSEAFNKRSEWMMSDFGRNHRKSPVSWRGSEGHGRGRGLRAGDRIADVLVIPQTLGGMDDRNGVSATPAAGSAPAGVRQNGKRPVGGPSVKLHKLLKYDRWTLLVSAPNADPSALRALSDACERAAAPIEIIGAVAAANDDRELGRPSDFCLIRPDGYIGLVSPLNRPDALRDYVAAFMPDASRPTVSATASPVSG